MLRPGSFLSRFSALALLIVLLLAAYQFVVQPLIDRYRDNQETIARSHDILQRYQALADEYPALAERLATLDEEKEESFAGYFDGPSDALAAAQLQNLAAEIIETADGEIRSTQILPVTEVESDPSVRRTGVKLRFGTTIDGLASALYDLETVEPHLIIDQLIISTERSRRFNDETDQDAKLDVRLDLFGYVRLTE